MARLKGTSLILWADGDGDHTIELRMPLQRPKPAAAVTVFRRESLDKSAIEYSAIGSGVHEAIADIKFEQNSQALIDMLLAGVRGKTLTVVPDADDPDRFWSCNLIQPTAARVEALIDADAGELEQHMVTIRLRRTNGKAFT